MKIKWTYPILKYGFNPPAVYRIDFDNGFYYIGSSMIVKTRWNTWRTNLKRDKFQSKLIENSIKTATAATVSILEFCKVLDEKALKERETEYLLSYFNDPLFLNMSPNGVTNEGLTFKVLPEQLIKPKKEKRSYIRGGKPKPKPADYVYAFSKGVVQFDIYGNYIMSHKDMNIAADHIGVHDSVIRGHIKTKRGYGVLGKYIFRMVGDNEPWELITKKEKPKPLLELSGKPVIDLNTGVFYYSAREVAEASGIKEKQLYKMLGGDIPNKTQYRYA